MQENQVTLANRKQNPVTFYLRALLYMFVALLLRVLAFAPLAALVLAPEGSALRYLALLCPVLLALLILPLRFSFAQALVQKRRERSFSFDKALGLDRYGEKLAEGLMHAINILKWALPLIALLVAGYLWYANTDAITLLKTLSQIGSTASSVWCAVANFFIGLFGGTPLIANGQLMEGAYTLLGFVGVTVLILLYGMVRNSSYRYIWVIASDVEKDPRAEARRRLRGHRWQQLGVGLVNLVLWLPCLLVVAMTLKGVLSQMSDSLMTSLMAGHLAVPDLMNAVMPLLFAFFVLYMPLLPVRRMLTCAFAARPLRHSPATDKVTINPAAVPETLAVPSTSSGAPTENSDLNA